MTVDLNCDKWTTVCIYANAIGVHTTGTLLGQTKGFWKQVAIKPLQILLEASGYQIQVAGATL